VEDTRGQATGALAEIYLLFNEGYTTDVAEQGARPALCEEAIRLCRLLLRLFPAEPEIMGLGALVLLQHARAVAHFDANGAVVLLKNQDRSLWDRRKIAEGLALVDKALRHRKPGPYPAQAAIAALHARAPTFADTDWAQIELLYGALERMQPSAVVTLNRAVAVSKSRGAAEALTMIEPLAPKLGGYFYFHRARGAFLKQLGPAEEARIVFDGAIALANTPAEAVHIQEQKESLSTPPELRRRHLPSSTSGVRTAPTPLCPRPARHLARASAGSRRRRAAKDFPKACRMAICPKVFTRQSTLSPIRQQRRP
jgi:RNA polymerase sigma-70 factor (ECF subfamily)